MTQTEERLTPSEIRDRDFAQLRGGLREWCVRVYAAFDKFGPGTTRQVAERSGIALLTLRPRACELYAEGWLECVRREGHEGVYQALTPVERAARDQAKTAAKDHAEQMALPFATAGAEG